MRLYHFDEQVARGAAVLDERVPGWESLVDLDALDLRCVHRCVLGQVGARRFGFRRDPYAETVAALQLELQTVRHGFNLAVPLPWAWQALHRAWVQEISLRRAARGVPADVRQPDFALAAG